MMKRVILISVTAMVAGMFAAATFFDFSIGDGISHASSGNYITFNSQVSGLQMEAWEHFVVIHDNKNFKCAYRFLFPVGNEGNKWNFEFSVESESGDLNQEVGILMQTALADVVTRAKGVKKSSIASMELKCIENLHASVVSTSLGSP